MDVERNLATVRQRIAEAAQRAGRNPDQVRLVAVTKTFPPESIIAAYKAGARDIGENRVQEAREKMPVVTEALGKDNPLNWHLIGHLQRRKAREAVESFSMIQSVDTLRLAETISRHAVSLGKPIRVLLQVNVANDPHKFGFTAEPRAEFLAQVERIVELESLQLQGLMTIGPLVADAEAARPAFRDLRLLRDELAARFPKKDWQELSMGMTDDFHVAIAEGATIVRIGRAIFGERIG